MEVFAPVHVHSSSSEGDLRDPRRKVITTAASLPHPHRIPMHRHCRAQLMYSAKGRLSVEVAQRRWLVDSHHAVWIPPGANHTVLADEGVDYRSIFVDPAAAYRLPKAAGLVVVTPLARALAEEASGFGDRYRQGSAEARLSCVLYDQLMVLEPVRAPVVMPRDPRLLRLCRSLVTDPGDQRPLAHWAQLCGASTRTLNRLFQRETGCSFGAWRQRLRITQAIERLSAGASVTETALDLGYGTPSAFCAMFRRLTGVSPGRYCVSQRQS